MRMLVTAFEPFAGEKLNSTQEVLNNLPDTINGAKICKLLLPVSFERVNEVFFETLRKTSFDYILMLGLYSGAKEMHLELAAHNLINSETSDNDGVQYEDRPIIQNAPFAYATELPVWDMLQYLKKHNVKAHVSSSAGNFVCNYLFFNCMHHINQNFLTTKAGFIHLPLLDEQSHGTRPSMPLAEIQRSVELSIEYLSKHGSLFNRLKEML